MAYMDNEALLVCIGLDGWTVMRITFGNLES
jgi:hypothetical protein